MEKLLSFETTKRRSVQGRRETSSRAYIIIWNIKLSIISKDLFLQIVVWFFRIIFWLICITITFKDTHLNASMFMHNLYQSFDLKIQIQIG